MDEPNEGNVSLRAESRIVMRAPEPREGARMFEFVRTHGGLEQNSAYAYLLLCERFGECCVIADADGETAGFILGITSHVRPDTLFVWQIGVAPLFRKQGLGARMLDALLERCRPSYLEAHVATSNAASEALFRALGRRRGAAFAVGAGLPSDWFPAAHEEERLVRIGPFSW